MDKDKGLSPFNPVVVNTGSKLVVIDTGLGPAMFEQSKGALGQFQTNLAAAGIDRNAVDTVVISHFHGDHINGLLTADNKAAYPNAEIMVPAVEWKFWMSDENLAKAPEGAERQLQQRAARVRRARQQGDAVRRRQGNRAGHHLGRDLRPYARPHVARHRVGQLQADRAGRRDGRDRRAVRAQSGLARRFDMDGAVAEATRRKLYDMAAAEKSMILGFHWAFPGLAYVEKDGAGYRLAPAPGARRSSRE